MKLNPKSWHSQLYTLYTDNRPGINFCNYFWAIILFTIAVPITLPILIWNKFVNRYIPPYIVLPLVVLISLFTRDYGNHMAMDFTFLNVVTLFLKGYYALFIGLIVVCAVLIGIAFIVSYATMKYSEYQRRKNPEGIEKESKPNMIITWFKAFKEKNCPIIDWSNEEK